MEPRKTLTLNKPLSSKTLSKIKIKQTPEDIKKRIVQDKQNKRQRIKDALQWLCTRYPDCFNLLVPKPLKLKIEEDIFKDCEAISKELPSKKSLRDAISYYAHNIKYLKSCLKQTHRIDLQGKELSDHPVIDEHIDYTKKMIEHVNTKRLKSKANNPSFKKSTAKNIKPKSKKLK